ncbi:hypothetical protein B1218_38690, partial [Pseudomonas ogarae]
IDQATFKAGKSIRAGVPVGWPGFGNLTRNRGNLQAMRVSNDPASAHGRVRAGGRQAGLASPGDAVAGVERLPGLDEVGGAGARQGRLDQSVVFFAGGQLLFRVAPGHQGGRLV